MCPESNICHLSHGVLLHPGVILQACPLLAQGMVEISSSCLHAHKRIIILQKCLLWKSNHTMEFLHMDVMYLRVLHQGINPKHMGLLKLVCIH
jgi:hypothetical protein